MYIFYILQYELYQWLLIQLRLYSWWWACVPPETCRVDLQRNKTSLHVVTSVGYSIEHEIFLFQKVEICSLSQTYSHPMDMRAVFQDVKSSRRDANQWRHLVRRLNTRNAAPFSPVNILDGPGIEENFPSFTDTPALLILLHRAFWYV